MPKKKSHEPRIQYVYLMGGLGNQLFQIAAGMYAAQNWNRELVIDESFENYRKNYDSNPDIRTFENSSYLFKSFKDSKISRFARFFGVLTRRSLEEKKSFSNEFLIQSLTVFLSLVLSISRRQRITAWSSRDIGYADLPLRGNSQLLVGYFQSYRFASDPRVREKLQSLNVDSVELEDLEKLSQLERPLVVHVRLGDYSQETKFGTLGSEYYSRALSELFDPSKFPRIWVFSDEIEQAKLLIDHKYSEFVRWFPGLGEPAAVTLEKMRLGHAYIIGNSSFSWWGAFLSKVEDAPTIAPTPWFSGLREPKDLIPTTWKRLARDTH